MIEKLEKLSDQMKSFDLKPNNDISFAYYSFFFGNGIDIIVLNVKKRNNYKRFN